MLGIALIMHAQQTGTEAPAAFATPTLATNPGTAPLWGLRTESRFMHDLASLTPEAAIARHKGEARGVTHSFNALTATQQQQLIAFLKSL